MRAEDLLSGAGAAEYGGRWNPPGVAAVYGSLSAAGALEEVVAYMDLRGIPLVDAMPRVFVRLRLRLRRVVDVCDGRVRQRLRVSRARMVSADWRRPEAITQTLGRVAFDLAVEALLVPSAASAHHANIVVFPANLRPSSMLATEGLP